MSDRRDHVPFDPRYFERLSKRGTRLTIAETFGLIHQNAHWKGGESVSGRGAARSQLHQLERLLPPLLQALEVKTLLDLPCGDFNAMRYIDLPVDVYLGGDIVPQVVRSNQRRFGSSAVRFLTLDITTGPLPSADLLLCRDCLVHLSFKDIWRALQVIRGSEIGYFLTTTFTDCRENEDITSGDWRLLNLENPPFCFPPPLKLLNEDCSEGYGVYRDKCLGLWTRENLPAARRSRRP